MFQPKLRRTFAALALTILLPLSGLQAMPVRQRQPGEEARVTERAELRELSLWRLLLGLWEKVGVRIDDNGLKVGLRIDGNG